MEESLVVCVEWSLTSAECVYVPINPSTQLFGICTEALKALGFKFDPEVLIHHLENFSIISLIPPQGMVLRICRDKDKLTEKERKTNFWV